MNIVIHNVTKQGAGFYAVCSVGSLNLNVTVAADDDIAVEAAVKSAISNAVTSFIRKLINKEVFDLFQFSGDITMKEQLDELLATIYARATDLPSTITEELNNYLIQLFGITLSDYNSFMSEITVERL